LNLTFEQSAAWLWLILPVTLLLAGWLYYYRRQEEDWTARLRATLAFMRWMVLFSLGVLLLMPSIVRWLTSEERPRLLIYTDASSSISRADRTAQEAWLDVARDRLGEKYEVRVMPFGAAPVPEAKQTELDTLYTDLGAVVTSINEDFYGENIGAVVVWSDGIQNKGSDPRYVALERDVPLYAMALGDSTVRMDLELTQVLNNRIAFLNNSFEIKARIRALKCKGKQTEVILERDGAVIARQPLRVEGQQFGGEVSFTTKADRVGMNKYTVRVAILDGERNVLNNAAEAFVDVLDNRTRIQVLAHAPHPDIAFLKRAMEASDQYEVVVDLLRDWDGRTNNADLYVLHGLPADANELNRIQPIVSDGKPTFQIITPEVSFRHWNSLGLGMIIEAARAKSDEVGGSTVDGFNLFALGKNEALKRYPPLRAPFGDYIIDVPHQVALQQRVGTVVIERPLSVYTERDGLKNGYFLGDGLWKWSMFESSIGADAFTEKLIQKSVQYLAIRQKRTRLSIDAPRRLEEREAAVFHAEYYNQSYELTTEAEVKLVVSNAADEAFDYRFRVHGSGYQLDIGALAPGEYRWEASTDMDGELFVESGVFTVIENRAEQVNLVANHALLDDWTKRQHGALYTTAHSDELTEALMALEQAKPVIHEERDWSSIISWKWILFILVVLMAIEWLVRKYTGYV
jgi:hypothetical protein